MLLWSHLTEVLVAAAGMTKPTAHDRGLLGRQVLGESPVASS